MILRDPVLDKLNKEAFESLRLWLDGGSDEISFKNDLYSFLYRIHQAGVEEGVKRGHQKSVHNSTGQPVAL